MTKVPDRTVRVYLKLTGLMVNAKSWWGSWQQASKHGNGAVAKSLKLYTQTGEV